MLGARVCRASAMGSSRSVANHTPALCRGFRLWSMNKKIYDERQGKVQSGSRIQWPRMPRLENQCEEITRESQLQNYYDYQASPLSYIQSTDSASASITDGETLFGYLTVKEGEKAAVWSQKGKLEIIDGPHRRFCAFDTIQFLNRHIADPTQFIEIIYKNGDKTHIEGPTSTWFDPIIHKTIKVNSNINVNQNEAIIVYRQSKQENNKVIRSVLYGPMMYSPKGDEWFHHFKWNSNHGSSQGVAFTKLRLTEDFINVNIKDALTKDNIPLKMKCVLYMKLHDIEKMLDATHDPIMVFINAINSDIVNNVSQFTFEQLRKSENYNKFNDVKSGIFKILNERCNELGYNINKILFEGFEISDDLANMFDNSTKIRIENSMKNEKEQENQKLKDYILDCQIKRNEKELAMQMAQNKNAIEMKRLANEEELKYQQELYDMKTDYYEQLSQKIKSQDMPKLAQLIKAEKEAKSIESMKIIRVENSDNNFDLDLVDHIDDSQTITLDKVNGKSKMDAGVAKSAKSKSK